MYSPNELLGSKHIKMESQISLSKSLNSRNLKETGTVLCCDTEKGVKTVKNLILNWGGNYLNIMILSSPRLYGEKNEKNASKKK